MRLRLRFSVLTLLVLVAVVALALGLVIGHYRAQQQVIAELRRRGCPVETEPSWLGRRTGLALFGDATTVFCNGEDIALLERLPRLGCVSILGGLTNDDAKPLGRLTRLTSLSLAG